MNKLSEQIQSGARAFLVTEYKYLSGFVFLVFAVLVIIYSLDPPTGKHFGGSGDRVDGIRAGACFLAGAILRCVYMFCDCVCDYILCVISDTYLSYLTTYIFYI